MLQNVIDCQLIHYWWHVFHVEDKTDSSSE